MKINLICANQKLPVKIIFLAFLGTGAVVTISGSRLFGIMSAMDYWHVDNNSLKLTAGIVAMSSSAYVVFMTRIVSLWSGINAPIEKKIKNTQIQYEFKIKQASCGKKGFAYTLIVLGIINGLIPVSSYLATRTILNAVNVDNNTIVYCATAYTALSNFAAYCGFTVKMAYKNAFYLTDGILNLKNYCSPDLIFKLSKTFGVSILGVSSYCILQYFLAKNSLLKVPITANLSPITVNVTAWSLCSLASSIYCINQPIQVFKFFSDTSEENKINFSALSFFRKILLGLHVLGGSIYLLFFGVLYYMSVIGLFESNALDSKSWSSQMLSIFIALSAVALEFSFSVRPMVKMGYKKLSEGQNVLNNEEENIDKTALLIKQYKNYSGQSGGIAALIINSSPIFTDVEVRNPIDSYDKNIPQNRVLDLI